MYPDLNGMDDHESPYQAIQDDKVEASSSDRLAESQKSESSLGPEEPLRKGFTEKELWEHTLANKDKFPDPTNHLAIVRLLLGITYAFDGLRRTFTDGYLLVSLYQSCIVGFFILLWLLASVGLSLGLIEAAIAIFGDRTAPWSDGTLIVYISFVVIIAIFWFIVLGLFMSPLIQSIISSESQKLSYVVELRMNGLQWSTRDILCGQVGDGPRCFSWAWFVNFAKGLIDVVIQKFFYFLLRNIKGLLAIICLQILAILASVIPGVGPIITSVFTILIFFMSIAYFFFDLVIMRKSMNFLSGMRTVWNNAALLAGLGIGYLLLAPFFLLIFPIAIISSTRLFVHLAAHGHTGRDETWWNIFLWYGVSLDMDGLQFDTRENLRHQQEQRRLNKLSASPAQPVTNNYNSNTNDNDNDETQRLL